jgi:glutamate synthase domain-containing protein 3
VNANYLRAEALDASDALELRALLEDYHQATASRTAQAMLQEWERAVASFAKYVPGKGAR